MIHTMIAEDYEGKFTSEILEKAAQIVLMLQDADEGVELSVVVDSDERLRELNLQFLGIDAPTDVLSFPADEVDPDSGLRYLGDIIISYPRAAEQAHAAGESIEDEIQLLTVHGTLHLLGFDHDDAQSKSAMWAVQQQALDHLGCKIRRLPEA